MHRKGWLSTVWLGALAGIAAPQASALTAHFSAADFFAATAPARVIDNTAFTPNPHADRAHERFLGTLRLGESTMNTEPAALPVQSPLGRDPRMFPGVSIGFFTDQGDLVPVTQDVIRFASKGQGRSFWDIIVQPGRVWSETGDDGWSRAAFPFALVNSIEGETHNGLAIFLYKGMKVSSVRLQIVQQTAPYDVKDQFLAAALIPATVESVPETDVEALTKVRKADRLDAVRIADWRELATKVGAARLEGFDGAMKTSNIVLSGLDYRGTFYLKECRSAAGPLPWCDRIRFGVWSATKALVNETALLRLAEKYGPAVFDLKIRDYVPEAARYPGWSAVRFEDAIDMATGIGNGSAKAEPNDTNDGYLDPSYTVWYEARSRKEKVAALLADGKVYPWGPGKVTRYRDQDMFILGVAMDAYLKSKEGPGADIWSLLQREVFEPIGIHEAPTNRTIEPDGSAGQPLMAYGYYPTISDMVLIARLYQNGGKHGRRQILYAQRVREMLAGSTPRGLPTGEKLPSGETTYINAFWVTPYRGANGCRIFYPRMIGWGGNIVALLPGGLTGIRVAKSDESVDNADVDTGGMARVAENLSEFCR